MPDGPEKPGSQSGSQLVERKLSTILSADVAEFSRLMGEDEEQTLRTFRGHKKVFESLVTMHRGRVFNTAGDAILAEFSSAVEAVRCATDIQSALRTRNDQLPVSRQVRFRIGVNLGDVMIQGQDLMGDGVNVAARLQTAAEPGGICISGSVHDQIRNKLSLSFVSLGEKSYKNIQQPVRTFSIVEGESGTILPHSQPRSVWKGPAIWIAAALLLVAGGGYAAYAIHQRSKIESPPVMTAAVQPQPASLPAAAPVPATPAHETPATAQPQPRVDSTAPIKHKPQVTSSPAKSDKPAGDPKLVTKSEPTSREPVASELMQPDANAGARATNPRRGAFDGHYSGPICYGKTPALPANCFNAKGIIHGNEIKAHWRPSNEPNNTVSLEGEIAASGDVTILMHGDRADGTRQFIINFTGTIHNGLLAASGKFLKGRPATLNWHIDHDADR
jgi:class 3 adenylate cyclase